MRQPAFHKKDRPFIWAHRGVRSLAPENTLAAGRLAPAAGADGWELDVRLTKDGRCAVLHDLGLLRTTDFRRHPELAGISPAIAPRLTLAQINTLDAGSWFAGRDPFGQVAAGRLEIDQARSYAGEPVPTLGQALDLSKELDLPVNVEFKRMRGHGGAAMVESAAAELRARDMAELILVSSFSLGYLKLFRKLCPEIAACWLTPRLDRDTAGILAELGLAGVHPRFSGAPPELTEALLEDGYLVNVYTVNQPEEMQRLIARRVSGIITDLPQDLRGLLGSE